MVFGRTDLPFLVVHGAAFWKLVLGGAVIIITAAVWLIWRWRSRPRIVGLVLVALASFGIGLKIEYSLGSSWGDACFGADLHTLTHDRVVDGPEDVSACVHAAAMPGSRDDALSHLLATLDHEPYRDETITRQLYALSAFVEGCDGLPQRLLHDGRFDEAATAAHDCSDRRREHLALRAAGKLDEAIRVEVPEERDGDRVLIALPDAAEWILTDHWQEAATAADHRASAIRTDHAAGSNQESIDLTATYYQCVAELFRSYAGDAAAATRLRRLVAGAHGGTCQVVLAAAATGDEHRDLVTRDPVDELREAASLRSALAMSETVDVDPLKGAEISTLAPEQLLDDPARTMGVSQMAQLWLTATAPPIASPSLLRLRWLTASQVITGDVGAAAKTAESAVAAASQLGADDLLAQYGARHVLLLPALVALHTSSTAAKLPPGTADDDSFGPVWLRANDPRASKATIDPTLVAAAQGDGSSLPAMLATVYRLSTDAQMMAVLPRLTTAREAVIRQLVWSSRPAGSPIRLVGEAFPFDDAIAAASRRDLFRVAGVEADATRSSEIFQRFDKRMRDRQRLVALLLWRLDRF